ncbi:MAG: hypothetical protein KC419_11495 [Anaerolineales bacterium]|nr:hypothetical protein [Anaerolineales bacterium]
MALVEKREAWRVYEGHYSLQEMTVHVRVLGDRLTVAFPGVPPGFEVILLPQEALHRFTMQGGPTNGAVCTFVINEAGEAVKLSVGEDYELTRSGPHAEPAFPTGQGLRAPELVLTPEKMAVFQTVLDEMMVNQDGRFLDYTLPYPKHEILQYLAMQDQFIFHGSNKSDIDLFSTKRTSMEINDRAGRGNLQAVYGTHDGLWPMFFAIIDRPNLTGSIRNGVNYFQNDQGAEIAIYHFSINRELLAKRPYRPGTLYILPRDTFRRLPMSDGIMSNEWASEVPVKPIARLALQPEDFPFLAQIGGHDDSALVRAQALSDRLIAAVNKIEREPDRIHMQLDWSTELGSVILEYIDMQRRFMPTAVLTLKFEPETVWLTIEGPPAYLQVLQNRTTSPT